MRRLFFSACLLLSQLFPGPLCAQDIDAGPAEEVAQNWVHEIDSGAYAASYEQGARVFQDRVPAAKWSVILKTIRQPLGKVISRKISSHTFYPSGYESTPGEFMVVIFDTSFENSVPYVENIVLLREDGRWRPVGYNAAPTTSQVPP